MDKFDELNISKVHAQAEEAKEAVEAVTAESPVDDKDTTKDAMELAIKHDMLQRLNNDPEYKALFGSKRNTIQVVNTLGFSDSGDIIKVGDKEGVKNKNGKPVSDIRQTAKVVGYRIKNLGEETLVVPSKKWYKDENGKFVSEDAEVVIPAGETGDITHKDFIMLLTKPEYSGEFNNGFATGKKSVTEMSKMPKESLVDMMRVNLSKDEAGNKFRKHGDEYKLNISEKDADGKWFVRPEYVDRFGYLNNEPDKKIREKKIREVKRLRGIHLKTQNLRVEFLARALADSAQEEVQPQA